FLTETDSEYILNVQPPKTALEQSRSYMAWKEEAELATELLLSSHEALIQYLMTWMVSKPS
ncbi:MAG: single-stranded-DNA-specific exonuclease C-terminal domain-containing protein, partial [Clostridia bacterium]